LYRVIEVTKEEGEVTIVSVSYASIAEAVEEADVEFTVPLVVYYEEDGSNGQILAKKCSGLLGCSWSFVKSTGEALYDVGKTSVGYVYDFGKTVATVFQAAFTGDIDINKRKDKTMEVVNITKGFGSSDNGGNLTMNGSSTLFFKLILRVRDYDVKFAQMSVGQYFDFILEGDLHLHKKIEYDGILQTFDVPDIVFKVGPLKIGVENTADIRLKFKADAQADMHAKLSFHEESELGFEYYEKGGFRPIKKFEHNFTHDYKYAAHGSISAGVAVGFRAKLLGVSGLDLSAGPSLELKSPRLPLTADSKTELNANMDFDVKAHLRLPLDIIDVSWGKSLSESLGNILSTKTLPSFDISLQDFDLKEMASGAFRLDFPFTINKPELGFLVEEAGICIEAERGECLKGPADGSGRFGVAAGVVGTEYTKYKAYNSGLAPGTYNLIPYFKSKDNNFYYDTANAVYGYVIGNTTPSSSSLAISSSSSVTISSSSSLTIPSSSSVTTADLIDSRDGQTYRTVRIGDQVWMAENLNYDATGSVCYGNSPANCNTYGRLYDWSTAMNLPASCNTSSCSSQIQNPHQGICPDGWHVPSDAEWMELADYVGGQYTAGTKLKAKSGWNNFLYDQDSGEMRSGNGTDDYRFSALPGGIAYYNTLTGNGNLESNIIGVRGYWWTTTGVDASAACKIIENHGSWISASNDHGGCGKDALLSIRCVKD
jgi:uncharacterized protein (TIGR02145 family)